MRTALANVKKFFPEVDTVSDADEHAYVEVVNEDSLAVRKNHKACALAVACKRMFDCDGVIISVKTAYLVVGTVALRYRLGESVSREVISFDRTGVFSPGNYRLLKPQGGHKLGEKGGNRPAKKNKKRVGPYHITDGIRAVLGSRYAAE
jgi:hypothetical protein